jgi:hypothetical protein
LIICRVLVAGLPKVNDNLSDVARQIQWDEARFVGIVFCRLWLETIASRCWFDIDDLSTRISAAGGLICRAASVRQTLADGRAVDGTPASIIVDARWFRREPWRHIGYEAVVVVLTRRCTRTDGGGLPFTVARLVTIEQRASDDPGDDIANRWTIIVIIIARRWDNTVPVRRRRR